MTYGDPPPPDPAPLVAAPAAAFDRRIVSILFADVVGFTTLSERLDAEDVATIQDAYFAATRETIERYGGVVEKFIGDAAMAVFGAPRARDDDAARAVRAGLALLGAIEQIGAQLGLEAGELQLRVGVNTGEVVHATDGTDAGRVTGDPVNTAARLQTAARPGSVLIGELTALSVAEEIETQSVGAIELKGKAEPTRVWEALGARSQPSREEALGALQAPMLGRKAQLGELTALLERVRAERSSRRVLVVAPPGVGKSRLLRELASVADGHVVRARLRPQGTAPYETVAQLFAASPGDLASALAAAGVPGGRAGVIVEEVRRLLDPAGSAVEGATDLAAEREVRFDAWLTALDVLAPSVSVWLVEDVHWAGGDLLAFLDLAGGSPTRHGRLVVATARPSLLETSPEWCETARIELDPLASADTTELVHALVGPALPEDVVAAIVRAADGTPLFVEELLRTWASVGTLVRADSGWQLTVQPDDVTLPQTVQAIYAAQLDDLPTDARHVARRGSVAGRRVPLAAFGPLELDHHREGLDVLRRRALFADPLEDPVTGASFAYRHALLRDAGYASLARAERSRLHLAMAHWLIEVAGERVVDAVAEAVAEHFACALESLPRLAARDLPDPAALAAEAAAWYERAAEGAVALAAVDAARRLFWRAIEHSSDGPPLDRARRRLRLGETLAASAELDVAIGELEAARSELAMTAGAAVEYERASFALGRAYAQQIRFPEATAVTQEAIDVLCAAAGDTSPARLHALHAWSLALNGVSDGVREEIEQAWEAAQESGDEARELDVFELRCLTLDELYGTDADDWAQLAQRGRALERWPQVAFAERICALRIAYASPRDGLRPLQDAYDVASSRGLREQSGWAEFGRCETLWVLGEWDAALDAGRRVLDLGERLAYERLTFRTFLVVLQIAAVRRDAELAERWDRWWNGAQSHFPATPSPSGRVHRGAYLVWLAEATGTPTPLPSPGLVEMIVPMSNPHFTGCVETIIRAWLDAGQDDVAAAAAKRWAAHASDDSATGLMRASAALVDAWVTGSHDSARRAERLAAAIPAPFWVSRAQTAANRT